MINLTDCGCDHSSEVLAGANGDNGANGNTILRGLGVPDVSLGYDGDSYIDRNSPFKIYEKIAGVWTYQGQLQGVDGNGFLLQKEVTLTTGEIATLYTLRKLLIEAPPTGFFYNVISAIGLASATGTGWAGITALTVKYVGLSGSTNTIAVFGSNLGGFNSIRQKAQPTQVSFIPDGYGVELFQPNANPTGGSLTIKIMLIYQLLAL